MLDIKKCEKCLHSRSIISEKGIHPICCLSQKKAVDCMISRKSYFATVKKDDSKVIKG